MSKKTRKLTNKAGKLMKCDGKMLKKVIEAKGYKCHELSKMLRYCSDYLTTCCRTNQISDVAAKYLMDYKIFPQMYDLEGEIKVDESNEDKTKTAEGHVRGKLYIGEPKEDDPNCRRSPFSPTVQEIKKVLNEKYGYGPSPKYPSYVNASQKIAEGLYQLMEVAMNDLKHDREFKEMIKQAVKEAYEEL